MHRINFTVEQAQKVLKQVKPGSYYYSEAQRVIRESGREPLAQERNTGVDEYGL